MKIILACLVVVTVYLALIHASCISNGQCSNGNSCVDNGGYFLMEQNGWCFNMSCTVVENGNNGYNATVASVDAWQGDCSD